MPITIGQGEALGDSADRAVATAGQQVIDFIEEEHRPVPTAGFVEQALQVFLGFADILVLDLRGVDVEEGCVLLTGDGPGDGRLAVARRTIHEDPFTDAYLETLIGGWMLEWRDERLSLEVFADLKDTRSLSAWWRNDYNHRRPHSSLGYRTPAAFTARWARLRCGSGKEGEGILGPALLL